MQKEELKFYEKEFGFEIEKVKSHSTLINSEKVTSSSIHHPTPSIQDSATSNGKRDLLDKSWEFEVTKQASENETEAYEKFTFVQKDKYKRWRFFNFENPIFNLNVDPIGGYSAGDWEGDSYRKLTMGVKFYGEVGNVLGFNFE